MLKEFTTMTVTIKDFIVVTHAVSFDKLRALVPKELELDQLNIPGQGACALISATTFLNENMHWSPLESLGFDYYQTTYRTYVTHKGEAASYFFGTYIQHGPAFFAQRIAAKNTWQADYNVTIDYDSATRAYKKYQIAENSEHGGTLIEAESNGSLLQAIPPFTSGSEMSHFITHRLIGYFEMTSGVLGSMRVEHEEMNPVSAVLTYARLDLWKNLRLLAPEDFMNPYSVLIQPEIQFKAYPPVPLIHLSS